MRNLIKCSDCDGMYIQEEYENHECKIPIAFCVSSDGMRWATYDGISWFKLPSFKRDQPQGNKENNYRRGNSTNNQVLSSWCQFF